MFAVRDLLIAASLVAVAVAVIATLFPVREGVSPAPACSDCAFKLTGPYVLAQYGNYAAIQLGGREVARYGWAYAYGRPLRPGEAASCDPMFVYVIAGNAYVSCNATVPAIGGEATMPAYKPPSSLIPPPPPPPPLIWYKAVINYYSNYYYTTWCSNNIHVTVGSKELAFCSNSNWGTATVWFSNYGNLTAKDPGLQCNAGATPTRVDKYASGEVFSLTVSVSGNMVQFEGIAWIADLGVVVYMPGGANATIHSWMDYQHTLERAYIYLYACR